MAEPVTKIVFAAPTDTKLLAERMGLTVLELPLISRELYGQTVFYDTSVEAVNGLVDVACFDCPISPGTYPTGGKSPIFWTEWQAQ